LACEQFTIKTKFKDKLIALLVGEWLECTPNKGGRMNLKLSKTLIIYGAFLILAGTAGYLSNPEKAKTALMSGGTFGTLSIIWGVLGLRQVVWSLKAGWITVCFLSFVFAWRSAASWQAYFGGNTDKLFSAALISSMLAASVFVLFTFFKSRAQK
jgi:hypothetical protein